MVSCEELRAVNHQLRALNAELMAQIEELGNEVEGSGQVDVHWEALLASADIMLVLLDGEGRLQKYTPRAQKLFRLHPSDIGQPFAALQDQFGFRNEELLGAVGKVMQERVEVEREMMSEDSRWFLARLSPYHSARGNNDAVVIAFVDISKSKETELAQRHTEQRMKLIVESAKDYAIFTLNPQLSVSSWNTGAEAMFGYSEKEILGKQGQILFVPEDQEQGAPVEEMEKALEEGRAENERWHLRKDGSRFYGSGLVMPLREDDGTGPIIGFVKIMRDLTESKRVADDLMASHQRTVEILESINDAFYAVDSEFRFTYINKKAEEWWGKSGESLLGKHIWTEFPQTQGNEAYNMHLRAMQERQALHFETVSPIHGHWVEVNIYPDGQGGLSVYFLDINARKQIEAELSESEERLRLAVEAGEIGTCDWNYPSGDMHWNDVRFRMFGLYPQDRQVNIAEASSYIHPDDLDKLLRELKQGIEERGEHTEEYRVVWPDETVRRIRESGRVVEWHDGKPLRVISVLFDITATHEAQELLRRSHEELETRVEERTRELAQALGRVSAEVEQRRRAEAGRTALIRRIVNTQEEERGRISRELHDNLGQHLTAVMLGLQALEMQIGEITGGKRQSDVPQLNNLRALVDGLMKAGHRQAWELRPAELDALGLEAALDQYTRDWSERTGIEVDFRAVNWEARPSAEVEIALYRVVQEALTNVARHAEASMVSAHLEQSDTVINMIIEDNGRGFDTELNTGRLGVLGMQERLSLVGGTLDIESIPGDGTTLFARVPLA